MAVGVAQFVQLNPPDGAQLKVVTSSEYAGDNLMVLPVLTVVSLPANICGMGYTFTVTWPVSVKQLSLSFPTTAYTVVADGEALGEAICALSKPVEGSH